MTEFSGTPLKSILMACGKLLRWKVVLHANGCLQPSGHPKKFNFDQCLLGNLW